MADQPSSESADQASYPCHDPVHQYKGERAEEIHTLIHQGMAAMESECLDQANAAFAQALALARAESLSEWEAQALFGRGAGLDRAGKYRDAIPLFEQAQAMFAAAGSIRMEVNVSIFLANMLSKTGSPTRALSVVQHARRQAETGLAAGVLPHDEYQYELFGLSHELGRAYQGMGQVDQAQAAYQEALSLESLYMSTRQRSALYQDILSLYLENDDLEGALAFGEGVVEDLDSSDAEERTILIETWFQLGIVCLRSHDHRRSVRYSQQAYDLFQSNQRDTAFTGLSIADRAFIGRLFVNIGSAYGGLADSLATYARVLAYWRCGKDLLQEAGAEDVIVPRDNIEGLQRVCIEQVGAGAYAQLWQASEPTYQRLLADLAPQEEGWGSLLTRVGSQTMPTLIKTGKHPASTKSSRKKPRYTCQKGEGAGEDQREGR
jgi:tetratricopeptide (TPR) repeat protein